MAETAISTEKIQEALSQLQDVHTKLKTAMENAEGAATLIRAAWESTEAAPNFQRILGELIQKGPGLIQDTQSMIDYLQQGIADHQAADTKLSTPQG